MVSLESPFINESEAAGYLRVSVRTLQWWRHAGGGPQYVKLGTRVFYTRPHLDEWIGQRTRGTTSEDARSAARPSGGAS